MAYDHVKQAALNAQCLMFPEPGDYWDEMFQPVLVVLGVTPATVIFCETPKSAAEKASRWTWDLDVIASLSRDAFAKKLQYASKGMEGKTWADVSPRCHSAFSDFFKAALA